MNSLTLTLRHLEKDVRISRLTETSLKFFDFNTSSLIKKDVRLKHVAKNLVSSAWNQWIGARADSPFQYQQLGSEKVNRNSCNLLEPKKVTQALTDPSWIEAMQDELL
ncbi:hypothetical protein Tco_0643034 [Tanacetum coccineum]